MSGRRRGLSTLLLAILFAGGARDAALAQSAAATVSPAVQERLRQIESTKRHDLESEGYLKLPGEGRNLWNVGAWETLTYIDFANDDRSNALMDLLKSLTIRDTRLWFSGQFGPKYAAYVRARTQDLAFSVAPPLAKPDFTILQPLDLDMGYFDIIPAQTTRVRFGRQFLRVGNGLTLSEVLDGGWVTHSERGISYQLFYGTTPNRLLNVDSSLIGFNKGLTHRDFSGGEVAYLHPSGNRFFAYHVGQVDRSGTQDPGQAALDFHTASNYTGGGATLRCGKQAALLGEYVHEEGHTLAAVATPVRVPISANACDLQYLYSLKGGHSQLATLEYAYGSGDQGRASVTNTFGGKVNTLPDHNFLYFGLIETGLALSPRLSNLHMARVGYQRKIRMSRRADPRTDMLVGTKFTEYYKEHQAGAISDPLATGPGSHVGSAWDAYTAWRIYSDLAINIQYGTFNPGDAYPIDRQSSGDRLVLSSTLSF